MSKIQSFRTYQSGSDPAVAFASAQAEARRVLGHQAEDPDAWGGTVLFKHSFHVVDMDPVHLSVARRLAQLWIDNENRRFGSGYAGAIPVKDFYTGRLAGWLFVGWDPTA